MAAKLIGRIVTLQNIALVSLAISFLLVKVLPDKTVPDGQPLIWTLLRVFGAGFGFYCILWGVVYPYLLSPVRHFPKIEVLGVPILGVFGKPPGQQFLEWSSATPNDGLILLRAPFAPARLIATKPKALADLLVANAYDFVKPKRVRDFLRHVLGDGLIIVEGDVHRFQRKHVMPAFSFRHVKDLYPMMFKKSIALTDALGAELATQHPQSAGGATSGSTEINAWASKVTLDIIGIAGMGKELNVLKNTDDPLVQQYDILLEPSREKVVFSAFSIFLGRKLVKLFPWRLNQEFAETTGNLVSICTQNVRERREAIKTGSDDHFDILSLLIKSNDFSDRELVDQLLTFLAAGHETTSSAFTWVCYLLAAHPTYQTRLREEVKAALPTNPLRDSSIDIAGILERLPLLNGVCNETLRLYPTVPITMRIAIRDTQLLGQPIPRGTEILVSPWSVNRSKELWGPEAESFVPERWIDASTNPGEPDRPNNHGGADSNYSLLTFLHGPRSCIGQGFAKAELRCLVVAFICAFEWELDMREEDVVPGGVITIKPRKGLYLRMRSLGEW